MNIELLDADNEIARLRAELQKKNEEISRLKAPLTGPKPKMKWGCYEFEGETGLFCIPCFRTKGEKNPTTSLNTRFRRCSVCSREFGAL